METYAKYKVLMIKEEGNTSHVIQIYDQYYANQYKAILKEDTSFLSSSIPETRGVLNYWCLVNVGLHYVKKLSRESWISSFNKFNLHPKHLVSLSRLCDSIKPCLQGGYSFKQDTTLTIDDESDLQPSFWKVM